jgi:hypothetical protein
MGLLNLLSKGHMPFQNGYITHERSIVIVIVPDAALADARFPSALL